MGAVRLELTDSEEEGFTVPCNCHYATPPKRRKGCWRKDLNPQPSAYKADALPLSYTSMFRCGNLARCDFYIQEV